MAIGTPTSIGSATLPSSSTTTIQMTVSASAAVGDLVIVDVGNDGGANLPSGVTDSAGNTYTADVAGLRDADDYSYRRFSTVVTSALTSGVSTITGTVNGGGGTWDKIIAAAKVTGSWDANRIDKTTSATGSSTSPDSGLTATTTVADELVYGAMFAGGAPSGATPLTAATNSNTILHNIQGGSFTDLATVYRIVSATGTYRASGTWQFTDLWGCYVVTYKEAAGGSSQQVDPSAIASGSQLFAPSVTPGAVTVSPSAISSGSSVPAPTLTPGSVTISPTAIASGSQVFAPSTGGETTVSPDAIASGSQVFDPALSATFTLEPDAIASGETVYDPTLTPGSVTVSPAFLGSGALVYGPDISGGEVQVSTTRRIPVIPVIPEIPSRD